MINFLTPKLKKDFFVVLFSFSLVGNMYQYITYSNKVSVEVTKEIQTLTEERDLYLKSYYEVVNQNQKLKEQLYKLKDDIVTSVTKYPQPVKKQKKKQKPVQEHEVIQVPVYEIMEK